MRSYASNNGCCQGGPAKLMEELTLLGRRPPVHSVALLAEAHAVSRFRADCRREVARSLTGSRPGRALADVPFVVDFAPDLGEVRARAIDECKV